MANTANKKPVKKTVEKPLDIDEGAVEETVYEEEETKEVVENKVSDDKATIAALQAQVEMLTKLVMAQQGGAAVQPVVQAPKEDTVKIIHLKDYTGTNLKTHIVLSNLTIDLRTFGEERTLTRQAFEELVGRYRGFFERGTIAPGADAGDVAKRYGLKKVTELNIPDQFLSRLASMDIYELEDLYMKLGDGHRRFMLEYWRRKVVEKNPAFCDIRKIEVLNRVSDGKMDSVILDLNTEKMREKIEAEKKK